MRSVASYEGPIEDLKSQLLSNPKLSPAAKEQLAKKVDAVAKKTREIRRAYPELANLKREDEGKIVALISQLETKGVPRSKIKHEVKLGNTQCSMR